MYYYGEYVLFRFWWLEFNIVRSLVRGKSASAQAAN